MLLHSQQLLDLLLHSAGANPNEKAANATTALHLAAHAGLVPAVSMLVSAGADTGAADPASGNTAWHMAAGQGQLQVVQALLGSRAATAATASYGGHATAVATAIATAGSPSRPPGAGGGRVSVDGRGSSVSSGPAGIAAVNTVGLMPLDVALCLLFALVAAPQQDVPRIAAQQHVVLLLVKTGASQPNHQLPATDAVPKPLQGLTPLMIVLQMQDMHLLEALLADGGAQPGMASAQGVAPLHLAARMQRADAAALLVSKGADPMAVEPSSGDTPLHIAAAASNLALMQTLCRGPGAAASNGSRRSGSFGGAMSMRRSASGSGAVSAPVSAAVNKAGCTALDIALARLWAAQQHADSRQEGDPLEGPVDPACSAPQPGRVVACLVAGGMSDVDAALPAVQALPAALHGLLPLQV